jgi:regulator of RNase E activity RraA
LVRAVKSEGSGDDVGTSDVFSATSNRHARHGVIETTIPRPPSDVVAAFRNFGTAAVADALAGGGVVDQEVRPVTRGSRVCGPAVTVWTRPGDALYALKTTDIVEENDVVVIDAAGEKNVGSAGEIFAAYLQKRGAGGLVVDGAIRDSGGIADLGFPTFARGACPRFYGLDGPGAVNVPIQCGGVVVNPGDLMLGDDDGLVVIPHEMAAELLARVKARMVAEEGWIEALAAGKSVVEVYDIDGRLSRIDAADGR